MQRGWKMQPEGGLATLGTSPCSSVRAPAPGSVRGTEARRAREQDVIGGLASTPSCFEHDVEVLLQFSLADEVGEALGPQAHFIEFFVFGDR